jgi:hypothetical protein
VTSNQPKNELIVPAFATSILKLELKPLPANGFF